MCTPWCVVRCKMWDPQDKTRPDTMIMTCPDWGSNHWPSTCGVNTLTTRPPSISLFWSHSDCKSIIYNSEEVNSKPILYIAIKVEKLIFCINWRNHRRAIWHLSTLIGLCNPLIQWKFNLRVKNILYSAWNNNFCKGSY